MEDEQSGEQPALAGSRPPAAPQHGAPPTPQGLDWKAFWEDVKNLIRGGTNLGAELEASTQTPADDVLLGKIGIITAPVSIGKAGEIRLPVRGGTQDYIACAQTGFADTIAVNVMAEVVAFVPPNTVYVKPKL